MWVRELWDQRESAVEGKVKETEKESVHRILDVARILDLVCLVSNPNWCLSKETWERGRGEGRGREGDFCWLKEKLKCLSD